MYWKADPDPTRAPISPDESDVPIPEVDELTPEEPTLDAPVAAGADPPLAGVAPDEEEPDGDEPDDEDYYAVLGVAPRASAAAIRQAFRRQAMRWHPDHFTTASPQRQEYAGRRMRAVLAAQHTLGDPLRRHLYDRSRAGYRSAGASIGVGGHGGVSYARAAVPHSVARPSVNDNPAGILFGVLSAIVALALAGRALTALDDGPGTLLSIALIVLFAALAALFFSGDSVLARATNAYMEREPRMEPEDEEVVPAHVGVHPYATYSDGWDDEPRLSEDFETLVDEALATVPEEFQRYLDNVVVRVKDEPTDDELRRMKLRPCSLLLGLYEGVPLTHQSVFGGGPEVVTIFRGPIEAYCGDDDERIRRQVRATVLHELAHHFGMDHDAMPAWIK